MATGQLMFEVGIKSAQEQLDKIKQEFTKANGDLQKLLNLKVSIDGVDAVTKALNQIGDTTALRNLRNEIAALNREFSILSKGAGGSGDIAGRGLAADIERTSQSIERYTSKIKQLTEERTRLVGGTRNSSYQIFTDKILSYELSLEGARKKLAELNEQKKKPVASESLKKSTQDAQAFETALGRIETAIGGLKSGMNVNLTGDFAKWAQEVQNVTASVRELVEQFKQLQQIQAKTGGDTAIKSQTEEYKKEEEVLNSLVQKLEYYKRARERAEKTISELNSQYPNGFAQPWKDPAVHAAIQQDRELQEKTVASLDSKWDAFWKKHETQAVQFAQMLGKSLDGVTFDDFYKHATGKFQDLAKSWYAIFHSQGYDKTFLFDPDHDMKLLERLKELRKLKNEYKDSATFQRVDPNSAAELQLLESLKRKIDEYQNARNKAFSADPNQTAAMEKLYAAEAKHGEASVIVAAAKEKEAQFTKEVAQQQQKLNELQSKGASTQVTHGGLFDTQKFNTLQEAIDKIISEINRLQQAFTKLGENSSLSNLSTTINGLAVTLSSLSNAIKIQPLDEQVKALLERCEKAEAKLREVGDAAKYLNERAGAKTQQKASSIMGITGTEEEQLNKVTSTAERFMRLLVEIENQMAKIGKIQALGEQSGFSPALLKNAQTQLEALKKMVESTIKGTPIAEGLVIPASASQLAQFIQQFGLLKAQYKDVVTEADRFNKATEKGSSQAESRIRKLGMAFNDLKGYMKANGGSEAMKRLQSEIQGAIQKMRQLMNAGNFAGAVNVYERMAGSIRQAATATKEYERSVMGAASANSLLTSSEHQLANALKNSSDSMRGQSQVLSDLKMMATQYLGVWGAQGFLRNVIEIGGQLEMQRLSIGAILGDMAKANELFDRIKNLAVKSPFGVVELDSMTKQLSAYGFEYNELFDMTKRLADISAATGTSVDRLALALGHVRSEAALSGYTLRQFSMANIPLAKKLSEELTKVEGKFVSVADVRKRVRTKDIGYEQVLKVLKDLTDEGGMFYNAQEIMSESVKARFKNLKDSMDIMYGEIAESSVGNALKEVASLLTTLTRHWRELGAVLVAGAGYWAVNRFAMIAANKTMVQYNLTSGQFSARQLEMQAITGNLTRAQLLQAVATKKLAVADAEAAGAVLGLSRAQLQHVAITGKTVSAMNMATIATSKYTVAQLRTMVTMRNMNLGWLYTSLLTIKNGFNVAATAAWGFMKAMWPMLALSAVAEVFMSLKRESDQFAESANYVGQSARQMMKDIDDALKSVTSNGKPVDTETLREAVNTMKEVVQQNEFYTSEQQNQVDKAETLSKKYDVLLQQMKQMREEAEWQTVNESLIQNILANTGKEVVTGAITSEGVRRDFGTRFFNDSITENMEQVDKANSQLDSAVSMLSEYQNVMAKAIEENKNFGLSLEGKSWQEQIKIIAESEYWDEFVGSVRNAGSRFKDAADKVKDASDDVSDKWDEVINDDFKAVMVTMEHELKTNEDGVKSWAKTNQNTVKYMADGIAKALKLSEKNIEKFMKFFYELFGLEYKGKSEQKEPTQYDLQTEMSKKVLGNIIRHNKNNGQNGQNVATVEDINKILGTGEHAKTSASDVVKALKENAQKDLQEMKDIKKIYGETSAEYQKARKKYEKSLNIAVSNGISEDEIKTGKYKDKKDKKTTDEDARVLRERVRILKEAADSYQYWRDKVGESQAEAHMQDEFGQLLSEQKLQLKNADELKAKLQELRAEYSKKPQTKAMVEAIKEIDKELAQLDRKDFERDTERFLSQTQIQLDSLTRAWELFNDVRESTGNLELAVRISGVGGDGTRNLADDLKKKIQNDLAQIGVNAIPFDFNFSDKDIKEEVENAFERFKPQKPTDENDKKAMNEYNDKLSEYQSKIKGFIEIYKKWRDLQRNVTAKDLKIFADLLGKTEDYGSKLNQLRDKLSQTLESINLSEGTPEQKSIATRRAVASEEWEEAQLSAEFANLFNNAVAMSKNAFESEASYIEGLLDDLFELGLISPEKMKEWRDKITKARSEYSTSGFLGIKGATGAFLGGGYQGLIDYRKSKRNTIQEELSRLDPNSEEYKNKAKELKVQNQLIKKNEDAAKSMEQVMTAANTLKGAFDLLADLFNNMGATGMGNAMSDASSVLGGAMQGASALSALGPWGMAAGAGLGLVSGLFALHDKSLQRQIDALKDNNAAIEANTDAIKRARERTLGYDTGQLRKAMASTYRSMSDSDAKNALIDYYTANGYGTGYKQELSNLKKERENYIEMYNLEADKKNESGEALLEYKTRIAELDDQILHFSEDLSKDLFGIDFKGWASQLGDSLMTAFENGEDAAEAFKDTVQDIMRQVLHNMLSIGIIEPMMKRLQTKLFGENGRPGVFDPSNPEGTIDAAMKEITAFFGDGGDGQKMIEATKTFYERWEAFMNGYGLTLSQEDSSSSMSQGIKGITEQTADLLSAYLNAVRLDVSVIRTMDAKVLQEYWPSQIRLMTSGTQSLTNIEQHTLAIMRSSDAIERSNQAILDNINGLKSKTWSVPIA